MTIAAPHWLDLMQREYLDDFIPSGGGAIRFAVADAGALESLRTALAGRAPRAAFPC